MRGSDFVDLVLDLLPRRWAQLGFAALLVTMALTHSYGPVVWYVLDKAQGITEQMLPAVQDMVASIATPAPVTS